MSIQLGSGGLVVGGDGGGGGGGAGTVLQTETINLTEDITVDGTGVKILGLTFLTTAGAKQVVSFSGTGYASAADSVLTLRLVVDGLDVPGTLRANENFDQLLNTSFLWTVDGLTADMHSFEIWATTNIATILFWPVSLPTLAGAAQVVQEIAG